MAVRQEDLIALNQQIWDSMLGLTLASCEAVEVPARGCATVGACVQIVGAWQGAVRVDCTFALALRAAQLLTGRMEPELTLEEIRDTVGELANMAAGSVKALLPQPTHISLPSVADGRDYDLTVRKGRLLLQCPFNCEGERLLVSLIERDADAELRAGRPITRRVQ